MDFDLSDLLGGLGDASSYTADVVPTVSLQELLDNSASDYLGQYAGAIPDAASSVSDVVAALPSYSPEAYADVSVPGYQFGQNAVPSESIWDKLESIGKRLETPGGKLAVGLGGGALSMLDAYKKNKLLKEAMAKQQSAVDARTAAAQKYSAPVYYSSGRSAIANPTARGGAALFFANNGLRNNAVNPNATSYFAEGGALGYVSGGSSGQDDKVPAQLSDGEYVMDADVVSALGDGNNAAGAAKLDAMRQEIRKHKRSAPANKIPPKAKSPLSYMKKGK